MWWTKLLNTSPFESQECLDYIFEYDSNTRENKKIIKCENKRTQQTALKEILLGLVHTIYPNTPYTDSQELAFWSWSQKRKGFKRENNSLNLLFQSGQFLLLVKREKKSSIGRVHIRKNLYHFTVVSFYVKYEDKSGWICKRNSADTD